MGTPRNSAKCFLNSTLTLQKQKNLLAQKIVVLKRSNEGHSFPFYSNAFDWLFPKIRQSLFDQHIGMADKSEIYRERRGQTRDVRHGPEAWKVKELRVRYDPTKSVDMLISIAFYLIFVSVWSSVQFCSFITYHIYIWSVYLIFPIVDNFLLMACNCISVVSFVLINCIYIY